jgi:hypothetical protein
MDDRRHVWSKEVARRSARLALLESWRLLD